MLSNVITKYKYHFMSDATIIRYFQGVVEAYGIADWQALEIEKEIQRRNNEDLAMGREPRFMKNT